MEMKDMIAYLRSRKEGATVPELQQEFSLKYQEAREALSKLEEREFVECGDGLHYRWTAEDVNEKNYDNLGKADYKNRIKQIKSQLLWESPEFRAIVSECVKSGEFNVQRIKEKFHLGNFRVGRILERLVKMGILDESGERCLLLPRDYKAMNVDRGNPYIGEYRYDQGNCYLSRSFIERAREEREQELYGSPDDVTFFDCVRRMKWVANDADDEFDDLAEAIEVCDDEGLRNLLEDAMKMELTPVEERLVTSFDIISALFESSDPPTTKEQALRDIKLCFCMIEKLPPARRAIGVLQKTVELLSKPGRSDFEDIRSFFGCSEEDEEDE